MAAYEHDRRSSYLYANQVMEEIARRNLPVLPEIFAAFYAVACDKPGFVKQQLQKLEAGGRQATAVEIAEIGQKIYATTDDSVDRLAGYFGDVLARIAEKLDASQGPALQEAVKSLTLEVEKAGMPASVKGALQSVVLNTRSVAQREREIVHDVQRSIADVDKLRAELEEARQERDKFKAEARQDALTGALNRRSFDEYMQHLFRPTAPRGRPVSMVVLDIDHFKKINDSHGHDFGDEVLKEICQRIRTSVRDSGKVFRVGGEEFVIVLDGVNLMQAKQIAEKTRLSIANKEVPESAVAGVGPRLKVTVSCGVAEKRFNDTAVSIFSRADGLLYTAKNKGRDQVAA